MNTAIEQLQQLGFTQYEAQAYVSLLANSPANGYELAKASGIPRPNIYSVLSKLEEKGAVLRVDSPTGTQYAPVEPDELLARLKQHFQGSLELANRALNDIQCCDRLETILNTHGYPVLLEHARTMITTARQNLSLGVWPEEAQALSSEVRQAHERGVGITTLCLAGCPKPCAGCQGNLHRYPLAPNGSTRWLVLVPDGEEVLAGEIQAQENTHTVRTRQKMLVNLAAGYIRHSIALAAILESLDDRLETLLDPKTKDALASLHAQGDWFEEMRTLIHAKENNNETHATS